MTLGGWRFASASVVGTSHLKTGNVCQDSNDCQLHQLPGGENVLVAVVCDGAGSAMHGGEGAARCCSVFTGLVNDHLTNGNTVDQISVELARSWIMVIQGVLTREAESLSAELRAFASTLLGAIVGNSVATFMQVGDGAIVVSDSEETKYGHVFWPDKGEYENTTHFVTEDDAVEHMQFESVHRQIVELAMFSDGLQRLALDYRLSIAHEPFFRGLFVPVRDASQGRSSDLSRSLVDFLSSQRVNEKTDDDKTLVLASRLAASQSVARTQ